MTNDVPEQVRQWATDREAARREGDFAAADELRERIRAAGWEVTDAQAGPDLRPSEPSEPPSGQNPAEGAGMGTPSFQRPEDVPSLLELPPAFDVSVQWIVQGWPEDVRRGVASFRRGSPSRSQQHVVVDLAATPHAALPQDVDVVRLPPGAGWAVGRNAGLRRASGRVVLVADGSVEASGEALGPLLEALADPAVGVTGPFGIASDDLREFHDSAGPDVDAVEGYLMAVRRELVERGLRFDEKFRFYRTADIELCFQVKAMGLRATVTPAPVQRHVHRMWAATPEDERARLSKRNFYRFLDRWRGRSDLLVSRGGPGSPR